MIAGLAVVGTAVPAAALAATTVRTTAVSRGAAALARIDSQALAQAIGGLPSSQETAALVTVTDRDGHWAGASGVADLAAGAPARAGDEFRIGSISKVFVATVVLQLAAEHRISLDQPVQRYLPGLLRPGDPPVTITELLNHTSGLGPGNGVANNGSPEWFLQHRLDTYTTSQLIGSVLQQPLIFAPGTRQQYNGVNYIVLGMLIQRVTGHSYAEEIQRRILQPLGMQHTYVPTTNPAMPSPYLHGYYRPGPNANTPSTDISEQNPTLYGAQGAMISTAADLDRFITALFRGRLLPPAQLDDMFTIPAVASGPFRYGMGLMAYTFPNGLTVWGHTGETTGYVSGVFATRDGGRAVSFAFTPVEPADGNQVMAAQLRIVQAAYDSPTPGVSGGA